MKTINLWIPSPTHQTSTQDSTSDKSQRGSGPPVPPPPLDPRMLNLIFYLQRQRYFDFFSHTRRPTSHMPRMLGV